MVLDLQSSKSFFLQSNDKPNKIAYYLLDLLPDYDALDSRVAWVGEAGVGQVGMPIRLVNTPSVRLVLLGGAVKKRNAKNYIILSIFKNMIETSAYNHCIFKVKISTVQWCPTVLFK